MVICKLFGGLGNQLFQIAATIGYARRHGIDYRIPPKADNPWPSYRIDGIQYLAETIYTTLHYQEPAIYYDRRPYDISYQEIPYAPNIGLEGHFQSEKYFEHCKQEILKIFQGTSSYPLSAYCAIHVRRGDYLAMQGHLPVITMDYIRKTIGYMAGCGYHQFMVFGNDPEWNRENINDREFPGMRFLYSVNQEPLEDLRMASNCGASIGSNSSFSWWIYYLNSRPDRIGVLPSTWFGPAYGEVNTKDLYPKGCIII